MGKRHTLKCWIENFQATWDGVQTYGIRNNDRNFKVDDSIQLEEYVPPRVVKFENGETKTLEGYYTGRVMGATIQHITQGGTLGLPEDKCILGLHIWSRALFNSDTAP